MQLNTSVANCNTHITICRGMFLTLARASGISLRPADVYNGKQWWYRFSARGHFSDTRRKPCVTEDIGFAFKTVTNLSNQCHLFAPAFTNPHKHRHHWTQPK